jgi:D-amino-acid dehydrogenase
VQRVVVIGGGVVGLCAAEALRRRGGEVTVVDAATPGGGASAVNAGWIVPSLSGPVPEPGLVRTSLKWMLKADSPLYIKPRADLAFARWIFAFWRRCNARAYHAGLEATAELARRAMTLFDQLRANGVAFELHQDGLLFAYLTPTELEHDLRRLEPLRTFGYEPPAPLDRAAVHDLEPSLADVVVGGYLLAQERHVRPDSLMAGLVAHLTANGVEVRAKTAVMGFERHGSRVTAVQTTGGRIDADAALICAGAWTPGVARLAGVRLPIEAGKGYCLDYAPPPMQPIRHALYLHEARVAVTPLDGMVRLAGTMEFSGLNDRIPPKRVEAIARAGRRFLRDWPAGLGDARTGAGMRPMTPDGLPVIGLLPGYANLAVASGHAMLGVTLGPSTGEAIADLLVSGSPTDILKPFDPGRFGR